MTSSYLPATRHPWPCLLFVLPLLIAYEACVVLFGGAHPEALRNGADNWLRDAFGAVGLKFFWIPPLLLVLLFILWGFLKRGETRGDLVGTLAGMGIESVTFALGLWGLSRALAPMMKAAGVELDVATTETQPTGLQHIIPYVGAGIYEEAMFRLVLFSVLSWMFRRMELAWPFAFALAAFASATLFATAHHLGPQGEPYGNYKFFFRLVAGLYFAALFQFRGFGIAVGAHACYNLMVGISDG
jgi:Type II CAAX prenyl endopeptidase Rce1-like